MPAYYIHDAKFVPNCFNMILVLVWSIVPDEKLTIQTTYVNKTWNEKKINEIFENSGADLNLKLIQTHGRNGMETVKTFHLKGIRQAEIKFSSFGNFLVIYNQENQVGKLFKATNIYKCFDDIINDNYLLDFHIHNREFGKINKIVFDQRDKYVAFASKINIVIYSITDIANTHQCREKFRSYTLDEKYRSIIDINFDSKMPPKLQS